MYNTPFTQSCYWYLALWSRTLLLFNSDSGADEHFRQKVPSFVPRGFWWVLYAFRLLGDLFERISIQI